METPPSIAYDPVFLPDHEDVFEDLCANTVWDERMHSRKTASFGTPYNYSGMEYPLAAFPPRLEAVRRRVEDAVGWTPNNCLLNFYPDGRSKMGMHADDASGLVPGTAIAVVSLGATRPLVFRRRAGDERFVYELQPGSLLVMPLALQVEWQHGLPKCASAGPRISATFRRILEA